MAKISYHGKRVAARRAAVRRSLRERTNPARAQQYRLVQLVICGGVFVLLVALKLLFPRGVAGIAGRAEAALTQDADFQAAFAAVGQAIAGEKDVADSLEEAYTAVFAPDQYEARPSAARRRNTTAVTDRLSIALPSMEAPVLEGNSFSDRQTAIQEKEREEIFPSGSEIQVNGDLAEAYAMRETVSDSSEEMTETVSRSYTFFSMPLPEQVSMDQKVLGFECATPVYGTVTSTFGWRDHPVYGEDRFHYGLDIGAEEGTSIAAFGDGKIKAVGESASLGKYLMIDHSGGISTLYAHCSRIIASTGQEIHMGEKVAEVGSTGVSTGPHLHFEIHSGGIYLNPIYYVEVH